MSTFSNWNGPDGGGGNEAQFRLWKAEFDKLKAQLGNYPGTEDDPISEVWVDNAHVNTDLSIEAGPVIDYTKLAPVEMFDTTAGTGADAHSVILFGVLSQRVSAPAISKPSETKAASVYLKYVDSSPWDAIAHATATWDDTNNKWLGSLAAAASMLAGNQNLTFGLYSGTFAGAGPIFNAGDKAVWLGMATPAAAATTYTVNAYGDNFLPLVATLRPNGTVAVVQEVTVSEDVHGLGDGTGWAIGGQLTSDTVLTDELYDEAGHTVAVTEENATGDGGKLTVGSVEHDLHFKSHNLRLDVTDGNKTELLATLSDLTSNIYWQRSVSAVVDDSSWLTGTAPTTVTAYDPSLPQYATWVRVKTGTGTGGAYQDADIVAVNDPLGIAWARGIYLSGQMDDGVHPRGHIFLNGDIVLCKTGTSESLADAEVNNTIPAAGIDIKKVYGIGLEEVTVGSTTFWSPLSSAYGYASAKAAATVDISALDATHTLFSFMKPRYYTYTGSDVFTAGTVIALPQDKPNVLANISYEWFGPRKLHATDFFFGDSYVVWTPHHQPAYYGGDAWTTVNFPLEEYRTAAMQDDYDEINRDYGGLQSDYLETEQMISNPPGFIDTTLGEVLREIANPAYIHHRPFPGVSVLDSGSFSIPTNQTGFFVDGGDFIDDVTGSPAPAAGKVYPNVIMRIWHGNYLSMPENRAGVTPGDSTWQNYANVLRFVPDWGQVAGQPAVDNPVIAYSDGTKFYYMTPLGGLPSGKWVELEPTGRALQTIEGDVQIIGSGAAVADRSGLSVASGSIIMTAPSGNIDISTAGQINTVATGNISMASAATAQMAASPANGGVFTADGTGADIRAKADGVVNIMTTGSGNVNIETTMGGDVEMGATGTGDVTIHTEDGDIMLVSNNDAVNPKASLTLGSTGLSGTLNVDTATRAMKLGIEGPAVTATAGSRTPVAGDPSSEFGMDADTGIAFLTAARQGNAYAASRITVSPPAVATTSTGVLINTGGDGPTGGGAKTGSFVQLNRQPTSNPAGTEMMVLGSCEPNYTGGASILMSFLVGSNGSTASPVSANDVSLQFPGTYGRAPLVATSLLTRSTSSSVASSLTYVNVAANSWNGVLCTLRVMQTSIGAVLADGGTMGTLPAAYRPRDIVVVMLFNSSNDIQGTVTIGTNGALVYSGTDIPSGTSIYTPSVTYFLN